MKSTILAIDDDPIILEIYQVILSDLYDIRLAASGEEALEMLASCPRTDIILLDIMMQGMNGYEVCRSIRENPSLSHVKDNQYSAKSQVE
jgi:CheY-like chemotaxis protein